MTRFLIGVFFLLSGVKDGFSQNYIPYYNLVNEGDQHLYQHEFDKAAEKYYAAFEFEEALPWDAYHLVYCLDQIDPIAYELEMKRWLLHCSTRTWKTMRWLNIMPLNTEFSELFYYDIKLNEEGFSEKSRPVLDTLMYFTLPGEMRKMFMDSIRVYNMNIDPKYVLHKRLMHEEDSLRQVALLAYIQDEGYPGERYSGAAFGTQALRNMPENLYADFVHVLFEELKKGNIQPEEYGWVVDTHDNKYFQSDIVEEIQPNLAEIRANRLEIGMSVFFRRSIYGINIWEGKPVLLD